MSDQFTSTQTDVLDLLDDNLEHVRISFLELAQPTIGSRGDEDPPLSKPRRIVEAKC